MSLPEQSAELREIASRLITLADRVRSAVNKPNNQSDATEKDSFRLSRTKHLGNNNGAHPTLRPALPSAVLLRQIIHDRQARALFFDASLFADPAWDMLLDLTAARAEQARVSVTSLCIASGVPPTTALRWIGQLTDAGLLQRVADETDRRRAFIELTDRAADAMARYFAELNDSN